jgi:hypothetical protein
MGEFVFVCVLYVHLGSMCGSILCVCACVCVCVRSVCVFCVWVDRWEVIATTQAVSCFAPVHRSH